MNSNTSGYIVKNIWQLSERIVFQINNRAKVSQSLYSLRGLPLMQGKSIIMQIVKFSFPWTILPAVFLFLWSRFRKLVWFLWHLLLCMFELCQSGKEICGPLAVHQKPAEVTHSSSEVNNLLCLLDAPLMPPVCLAMRNRTVLFHA